MPILDTASIEELQRLLELFPLSALKEKWPNLKLSKEELCKKIASGRKHARKEIIELVDEYLSSCKQHVYICSHDSTVKRLPAFVVPGGDKILENSKGDVTRVLFLLWSEYHVVLRDPLEEVTLRFLWPLRVDFGKNTTIIRFVVLEKSIASRFKDRYHYAAQKTVGEDTILSIITSSFRGQLVSTDFNKGIKKLWEDDFIEGVRAQYKKPMSTATEIMDEEKGIKKFNRELYDLLMKVPLYSVIFTVLKKFNSTVSVFTADPSKGRITFPRYTEDKKDTEHVIREILGHNK